jgi:hypothetical protein
MAPKSRQRGGATTGCSIAYPSNGAGPVVYRRTSTTLHVAGSPSWVARGVFTRPLVKPKCWLASVEAGLPRPARRRAHPDALGGTLAYPQQRGCLSEGSLVDLVLHRVLHQSAYTGCTRLHGERSFYHEYNAPSDARGTLRCTFNAVVAGSIPARLTIISKQFSGRAVVVCHRRLSPYLQ